MNYTNAEIDAVNDEQILVNTYKDLKVADDAKAFSFIDKNKFYKLFWIFLIGSLFGCYMEQIQYYFHRGIWESRAGVVWGPFSEIYGLGAAILFLLSTKLQNTSPLSIFLISCVCGSAFEYLARLFQEIVFGSITWDYSKEPFNIAGRTSLKYGIYWGLLGLLFIKLIFPQTNKLLGYLKGKVAYAFTWVLIIFMSFNLLTSALAVNRWSERMLDVPSNSFVDQYLDSNYDDEKMDYIYPHLRFITTPGL